MSLRVTQKQHDSRIRRANLRVAISRAIYEETKKDDNFTVEEIVMVLGEELVAQQGHIIRHQLKDEN